LENTYRFCFLLDGVCQTAKECKDFSEVPTDLDDGTNYTCEYLEGTRIMFTLYATTFIMDGGILKYGNPEITNLLHHHFFLMYGVNSVCKLKNIELILINRQDSLIWIYSGRLTMENIKFKNEEENWCHPFVAYDTTAYASIDFHMLNVSNCYYEAFTNRSDKLSALLCSLARMTGPISDSLTIVNISSVSFKNCSFSVDKPSFMGGFCYCYNRNQNSGLLNSFFFFFFLERRREGDGKIPFLFLLFRDLNNICFSI
jgi:hypothetical protein